MKLVMYRGKQMKTFRVMVDNVDKFASVFGADCFLEWYPEITTVGVDVAKIELGGDSHYYIIKDGKVVSYGVFFTAADLKKMKRVKEPQGV